MMATTLATMPITLVITSRVPATASSHGACGTRTSSGIVVSADATMDYGIDFDLICVCALYRLLTSSSVIRRVFFVGIFCV